ncbi:MAG: hypothetical protein Q8N51_02005 [Gammaproteobacteria bacterium]|nr:hypothetical protein [Gammaproteobacteria bacterium]
MNSKGIALLSAAALLAAGAATAGEVGGGSDISWTYAQVGYVQQDGDDFFETDGFDVLASVALSDNWHAGLSYTALSGDGDYYGNAGIDFDTWDISIGYNAGLGKNSQAYFDVGYYDNEVDPDNNFGFDGAEGDGGGFRLTAGIRIQPAPKVELAAALTYANGDFDPDNTSYSTYDYNDTSFMVSGQYFFMPEFSVGARANFNGGTGESSYTGSDQFSIFARYSFGGEMSDMSDSSDASY